MRPATVLAHARSRCARRVMAGNGKRPAQSTQPAGTLFASQSPDQVEVPANYKASSQPLYVRCSSTRSNPCVAFALTTRRIFLQSEALFRHLPAPAQRAKLPAFFYLLASRTSVDDNRCQSGWLSMRNAKAAVLLAQFALAYTMVIQRITGSNNSELAFASSGGGT